MPMALYSLVRSLTLAHGPNGTFEPVPPLIGISSWREPVPEEGVDVPALVSHASYARAVEKAGGPPSCCPS